MAPVVFHTTYCGGDPIVQLRFSDEGPRFNGHLTCEFSDTPVNHLHLYIKVMEEIKKAVQAQRLMINDVTIVINLDIRTVSRTLK